MAGRGKGRFRLKQGRGGRVAAEAGGDRMESDPSWGRAAGVTPKEGGRVGPKGAFGVRLEAGVGGVGRVRLERGGRDAPKWGGGESVSGVRPKSGGRRIRVGPEGGEGGGAGSDSIMGIGGSGVEPALGGRE